MGLHEDGVELALQFARLGISVVGIDASSAKVSTIRGDPTVTTALLRKRFAASTDFSLVRDVDLTVLCIPAGQSDGEIDLALLGTGARLAPQIQRGSLIVIEAISQEHPICGELRSVLEHGSRLQEGRDFKLSFLGPSNGSSNPSARAAEIGLSYQLNGFASAAVVNSEPEFTSGNHNGRELPVSAPVGPRRRMDKDLAERLVNVALLCDVVVIVCTLLYGFWLRFHSGFPLFGTPAKVDLGNYTGYMVYGALSLIIVLGYYGVYDSRTLLRVRRINARMVKAGAVWFVVFLSVSLVFQFRPPISRIFVLIASATTMCGLIAWRTCFHMYLRRSSVIRRLQQRVLFIGWSDEARRLASTFAKDRSSAYIIAGCLPSPGSPRAQIPERLVQTFGIKDDLKSLLHRQSVDAVILADCDLPQQEILRVAAVCEQELVAFKIIPSYFRILVSGLHLETMNGTPILGVSRLPLDRFLNVFLKGAIDMVGAIAGILLSAPIMLIVGLLIYLESPGPVVYRQRRLGRNGKPFYIFKIRSMRLHAEEEGQIGWTVKDDPRCLKVGAFIRRWNIDEVPQFWNVLRGEMSLVGPRPERPELVVDFKGVIPHYQARHSVKPGMTGWAQIKGLRGDTDLTDRITSDIFYLENWSLLLDLQILAMTFLKNKNAC